MNYTTFFVAFIALGLIVFVGIFGAAWMSAADPRPERGHTFPVPPPAVPPPPLEETDNPLLLEGTSVSPSSRHDSAFISSTTQSSFNNSQEEYDPTLISLGENSQETTPETLDGSARKAPTESSDELTTLTSCTLTTLTKESGEIKPNYENEDSCQQWLVQYEEGYSVDITVDRLDLDGASNDYVLVSPDADTIYDVNNPILSWKITGRRYYRIPYKGTAFVLFVTHKSGTVIKKPGGFRIVYSRNGELTSAEPPTTSGPIPTPPPDDKESIIVTVELADHNIEEFRRAVANEATDFCGKENITSKTAITYEHVYLSNPTKCLSTWPNSEKCYSFTMAIPIDYRGKEYELTKDHLQKMWNDWDDKDLINIRKTNGPSYKRHVTIWVLTCTAFIILFSILLIFLWQWTIRSTYNSEEKEPRISASIEVPPFLDYFDTRYDDPEYLPYYDSMYQMGTETSTDDVKVSYGALPPYTQRPSNMSSTFHFTRPSNAGIDNNAFFVEEDEDEYEILNRSSLTKATKKMDTENVNKTSEIQDAKKTSTKSDHIYEDPNPVEEEKL